MKYSSEMEISTLNDSVNTIVEKLFARATDGKSLQYGREMPAPACANPLSIEEVETWDTEPMHFERVRVARVSRRLGSRDFSKVEKLSSRSNANPFFGYRSDPPTAQVFKEGEALGPIASAVKAAGELSAIAIKAGESDEKIWNCLTGTWGVNVNAIKEYVTPSTKESSFKDMIKTIRQSSHMLYGFNAIAPSVIVSGGSYRPEAIPEALLIDYHKLYLSMRYMGEFACRYIKHKFPIGSRTKFAPVFDEAEVLSKGIFSENIVVMPNATIPDALVKASNNTMKYFTGVIATYGVASVVKKSSSNVKITSTAEDGVDILRALQKQNLLSNLRLGPNALIEKPAANSYDIRSDMPKIHMPYASRSTAKLKLQYIATWKSASALAFEVCFLARTNATATLVSCMRKKNIVPLMTETERVKFAKVIAINVPKDIGFLIYCILVRLSMKELDAKVEFCKMINALYDGKNVDLKLNYSEAFISALSDKNAIEIALSMIQSGYNRSSTIVHSTKKLEFEAVAGNMISDVFETAIVKYVKSKAKFWQIHYDSRVIDMRNDLKGFASQLKKLTKSDSYVDEEIKRSSLVNTRILSRKVYEDDDINTLKNKISDAKAKIISYAFLSAAYGHITYDVDALLRVHIKFSPEDFRNLLLHSADNYAKKRMTWSKDLAEKAKLWATEKDKIFTFTRLVDMARFLDEFFEPDIKWLTLYELALDKFKVTANSLSRVIKERVANLMESSTSELDEIEEDDEMEDLNIVILSYRSAVSKADYINRVFENPEEANPFAILAEDSDDEHDEFGNFIEATPDRIIDKPTQVTSSKTDEPMTFAQMMELMRAKQQKANEAANALANINPQFDFFEVLESKHMIHLDEAEKAQVHIKLGCTQEDLTSDMNNIDDLIEKFLICRDALSTATTVSELFERVEADEEDLGGGDIN